jgi:hypothetical protein
MLRNYAVNGNRMRVIRNTGTVLAHWVYTREEWKLFLQWERKRLGWFRYLLRQLLAADQQKIPEITITGESITIHNHTLAFRKETYQLRRVHLRETGVLNILEIMYQKLPNSIQVIRVPVPKGELRNAMMVQECLGGSCK